MLWASPLLFADFTGAHESRLSQSQEFEGCLLTTVFKDSDLCKLSIVIHLRSSSVLIKSHSSVLEAVPVACCRVQTFMTPPALGMIVCVCISLAALLPSGLSLSR